MRGCQKSLLQSVTYNLRRDKPGKPVAVTVRPASENSGICFVRSDRGAGSGAVAADWRSARIGGDDIDLVDGDGVFVGKVGSLLAALKIAGIDDAVVEVDAETVDADCRDVIALLTGLEECGVKRRAAARGKAPLRKCVAIEADGHCALALPADRLIVELYIDDKAGGGDWCVAEFDACRPFSEAAAANQCGDFGIRVKGGECSREWMFERMLPVLGLLALHDGGLGMLFRGINFTLDIGWRLLQLVSGEPGDGDKYSAMCSSSV